MNFGDTSALKKELHDRNNPSFQERDVHQAILNIGYSWWQAKENGSKSYGDMINWVQFNYGDLAAFAILAGKYNQQVCNGGHMQYYDNGYASGSGGFGSTRKEDCPLHTKMVKLFESLGFSESAPGSKVYGIMSEFKIGSEYEQNDYYNCDDEDDDDDWDEEDGELVYFVVNGDDLDNRYYKVNDEWIEFFNETLKNRLCA